MPIDAIAATSQTELLDVLELARQSPFYSQRLPSTALVSSWRERLANPSAAATFGEEFWQEIRPTTKADLRDAYPFGLLAVPRSELATYHESSGTTGTATASYFTDADWDD